MWLLIVAAVLKPAWAILGGSIADAREYPWYVSFISNDSWGRNASLANNCGGTLIASNWVITARHCKNAFDSAEKDYYWKYGVHPLYKVGVNVANDGSFGKMIPIEKFEVCPDKKYPPGFNGTLPPGFKPYNDCALVKLSEDARLYGAKVAPMFRGDLKPFGHEVTIVGMGSYGFCSDCRCSPFLRAAKTVVAGDANCEPPETKFGVYHPKKSICAGKADVHVRTGYGDSGGPLFIFNENTNRTEYIGTVSGGVGIPGGERNFTRFVYSGHVAEWVDRVVRADVVLVGREATGVVGLDSVKMATKMTGNIPSLPVLATVVFVSAMSLATCSVLRLRARRAHGRVVLHDGGDYSRLAKLGP